MLVVVASAAPVRPPNIVFIFPEVLGGTDIGAYPRYFTGAKSEGLYYETPHRDRLIAGGIAFSQSYANELSSPTIAAIDPDPAPCPLRARLRVSRQMASRRP